MTHHVCGARLKRCRKCKHRFTKEEYDLLACPECGEDRTCKTPVAGPGMRCRLHGGKSLSGPAAPAWRHGRYSRTLPTGLVRRYEESLADPELLALRDEIALLDAHTLELIATLSNSEGPALWQQLQELQTGLSAAVSQSSPLKNR